MWTLHHVNWYRTLWWADRLGSIPTEGPSGPAVPTQANPRGATTVLLREGEAGEAGEAGDLTCGEDEN